MSACVEVTDKDGQTVGTVTAKEFGAWRKNLGGNVAFLWAGGGGDVIVDSRGAMEELPPGEHRGALLRRMPIPRAARRQLGGCDLWGAA